MEITGGVNIRAAWYDRNPKVKSLNYQSGLIGPHGDTERAIVNITANKKAMVGEINLSRYMAASGAPFGNGNIWVYSNKGEADQALLGIIAQETESELVRYTANFYSGVILGPGVEISIWTEDTNTAGTSYWVGLVAYTEFDA